MNKLISTAIILILATMIAINLSSNYLIFGLSSMLFFIVGICLWNKKIKVGNHHNVRIVKCNPVKNYIWKYSMILLLALMLYWYAYYPGGFNLDALG